MSNLAALAIISAVTLVPVSAEAGTCYADWSVAAPIVRKEGLMTVERLAALGEGRLAGDIVKTTLCEEASGFVYRLVLRDTHGKLTNKTVNARSPFDK